jgi:hypothetical protein
VHAVHRRLKVRRTVVDEANDRPPSRADVRDWLNALLSGAVTRNEASAFAWYWFEKDGIDDPIVWTAISDLLGAQTPTIDREWLYGESDFRSWLDRVEAAGPSEP